jgi:hypothetical protein
MQVNDSVENINIQILEHPSRWNQINMQVGGKWPAYKSMDSIQWKMTSMQVKTLFSA